MHEKWGKTGGGGGIIFLLAQMDGLISGGL